MRGNKCNNIITRLKIYSFKRKSILINANVSSYGYFDKTKSLQVHFNSVQN